MNTPPSPTRPGAPDRPPVPRRFRAPWAAPLRVVTALVVGLLAGVSILLWVLPDVPMAASLATTLGTLALAAGGFACAVWGYEVSPGRLRILRTGWVTTLPLDTLETVEFDPKAANGALRLLGNGGLFVFAGLFWNRRTGRFRAFATDFTRSVVLRFPGRVVVVTPEPPIEFVEQVGRLAWPGRPGGGDSR